MRQNLLDLINKTIVFEYQLPNTAGALPQCVVSNIKDDCFSCLDEKNLSTLIYNAVIDYSFDEYDINKHDLDNLYIKALLQKIKYSKDSPKSVKLKHGFYGEVILYCILRSHYSTNCIISRGHFYNPLENSETKGFDSYHLIESTSSKSSSLELWFGEAKFYKSHSMGINSVMKNINKAISSDYLDKNFIAIFSKDKNIDPNSTIKKIFDEWDNNPTVKPIDFVKSYNGKLIYPIMILYQSNDNDYNKNILKAVDYINKKHKSMNFNLPIPYSVFFIFIPLNNVKDIKGRVIEWIEKQEPLI